MKEINTFRGSNIIVTAYSQGKEGLVMEDNPNNPFRLHRFKKKFNSNVTGKKINGKFAVVFWDNLINKLEKEKYEST